MTEGAFGIGGGALLRAREARARKILAFFRVGSGVLTPFLKLGKEVRRMFKKIYNF